MMATDIATRDERIRELRASGLTFHAIEEKLGISHSVAWAACNRDLVNKRNRARKLQKREWAKGHRAACPRCGEPMGPGTKGIAAMPACCGTCHKAIKRETVEARDRVLERLWAEGKSMAEIAPHFGWSLGHLANQLHIARERGANLPYRNRSGRRFPHLKEGAE